MTVRLADVEAAFRSAFSRELCAEDDLPYWTPENPSRGHCAIAALTLRDLLGGDLLMAAVHRAGEQTGFHYWNRLAGIEVDMTADQFFPDEIVGTPELVVPPPGKPNRYATQYERFRSSVIETLGLEPSKEGLDAAHS